MIVIVVFDAIEIVCVYYVCILRVSTLVAEDGASTEAHKCAEAV